MKVSELAQLLDLTPRRVQQLVGDQVIPRAVAGVYDPARCVVAYIRYLRRLAQGDGSLSLTDERTRLARLQADQKELEIRVTQGDVVSTDWVVESFGRVFEVFRARALSLPQKAAPGAFGAASLVAAKEAIEREVYELLEVLALPDEKVLAKYEGDKNARRKGKKTPDSRRRGRNGAAAAEVDG